jgi:hypothetical protein
MMPTRIGAIADVWVMISELGYVQLRGGREIGKEKDLPACCIPRHIWLHDEATQAPKVSSGVDLELQYQVSYD